MKEFGTQCRVVFKNTVVVSGDRSRMLLFDTSHLHAQMFARTLHDYAFGTGSFKHLVADLGSEAFLHLKTTGKYIYNARQLAESDNFIRWYVSNAYLAEERKYMMLAHGVKLDVLSLRARREPAP